MTNVDAAKYQALFEEVWDQLYRLHTNRTVFICLYDTQPSDSTCLDTKLRDPSRRKNTVP
jgi:hypothetical protein